MKNTPLPQTSADPADPVRKLAVDVPTMCTMLHVGLSTGWNLVTKPAPDTGKPPMRALRALADDRRAPLILMPRITIHEGQPREATGDAALTLQAIGGLLKR